jgi:hypothetical protein
VNFAVLRHSCRTLPSGLIQWTYSRGIPQITEGNFIFLPLYRQAKGQPRKGFDDAPRAPAAVREPYLGARRGPPPASNTRLINDGIIGIGSRAIMLGLIDEIVPTPTERYLEGRALR